MSNSFRVRNYCCRSYFRVVLKSKMKWKCWNRLDVKSKRTHHKHTRVATRGVLSTVQRTNNSIKKFYPDSNMHIFQFLLFASLKTGLNNVLRMSVTSLVLPSIARAAKHSCEVKFMHLSGPSSTIC